MNEAHPAGQRRKTFAISARGNQFWIDCHFNIADKSEASRYHSMPLLISPILIRDYRALRSFCGGTRIHESRCAQYAVILKREGALFVALAWLRQVIEKRIRKNLCGCGESRAVIDFSVAQLRGGRCHIHADQIILLRGQSHRVLLQKCILRIQLGFGIAIDSLLLSNKAKS